MLEPLMGTSLADLTSSCMPIMFSYHLFLDARTLCGKMAHRFDPIKRGSKELGSYVSQVGDNLPPTYIIIIGMSSSLRSIYTHTNYYGSTLSGGPMVYIILDL